jgi:hypothetical protein
MSRCTVLLLVAGLTAVGCAPERDPIEANELLGPDDQGAVAVLTPEEGADARAAMRAALAGTPIERPRRADEDGGPGVRWSDVPAAAYWGAVESEMAIIRTVEIPEGFRFELVTLRDEPATLTVERGDQIRATASVGSFGQRTDEARALEVAFRTALEAFGRKPSFE